MTERYKDLFPAARAMQRTFFFHAGPTNSGKTHAALERLVSAPNGVYAAPLRLLALEGYDRLSADLPERAAMRTGEEDIGVVDATHVSCTIEMLPLNHHFNVVVIDEVQMLADAARGGAWTRAVLGVQADEVHLVGGPEALPIIKTLLDMTGETLEVIQYDRKCPLIAEEKTVSEIHHLVPGDAIIAFSRRSVLKMRANLIKAGVSVAVIYGDLSPEIRRREAERFRTGEAAVLVATDAVGMGLNLPIRRILFSETQKFNGVDTVKLPHTDVLQIAGRAGRYGLHEEGKVGTFGLTHKAHADFLNAHDLSRPASLDNMKAVFEPSSEDLLKFWIEDEDLMAAIANFYSSYAEPQLQEIDYDWVYDLYSGDNKTLACAVFRAPVRFSRGHWDPARSAKLFEAFWRAYPDNGVSPPLFALASVKNAKDMTEAESYLSAATLYFWLAKRWPHMFPDTDLVRSTRDLVATLMAEALGSTNLLARSCSDCGRNLDPDHPYGMCEACFADRHAYYEQDFSYTRYDRVNNEDDDDDFDKYAYEMSYFEERWKQQEAEDLRHKEERRKLGPLTKQNNVAQKLGVPENLFASWVGRGIVQATTHNLRGPAAWSDADIEDLRGKVPDLLQAYPRPKNTKKKKSQTA